MEVGEGQMAPGVPYVQVSPQGVEGQDWEALKAGPPGTWCLQVIA